MIMSYIDNNYTCQESKTSKCYLPKTILIVFYLFYIHLLHEMKISRKQNVK